LKLVFIVEDDFPCEDKKRKHNENTTFNVRHGLQLIKRAIAISAVETVAVFALSGHLSECVAGRVTAVFRQCSAKY